MRDHRECDPAGARLGRPCDARILEHHTAPGQGLRQRGRVPVPVPSGQRAVRGQLRRPGRQIYGAKGRDAAQAVTLDDARALDASRPLAFARERFRLPDGIVYLDGNSLGALPVATVERLKLVAERQWGEDLISSWTKHDWIDWPVRIAAKLAPIVGARPSGLLIA